MFGRHILSSALAICVIGMSSMPLAAVENGVSTVQVHITGRDYAHREPWQAGQSVSNPVTGVYLGNDRVLVLAPELKQAVTATVRFQDLEYTARIRSFDNTLGLAVLELDRSEAYHDPLKNLAGAQLNGDFAYSNAGQPLRLLSRTADHARTREFTIVYEGTDAAGLESEAGGNIPAVRFSGWAPGARRGDVLVQADKVVGLVLSFSEEHKEGLAVPVPLLRTFISAAYKGEQVAPPLSVIDFQRERNQTDHSVLMHCGFEFQVLKNETGRRYYGLAPGTHAVLVSKVLPWMHNHTALKEGDVIVAIQQDSVDKQARLLQEGALIKDDVMGMQPLDAALTTRAGVPLPEGTRFKLTVVRNRRKEVIDYRIAPFSYSHLAVPQSFDRPAYMIVGGLVLVELSERYLNELEHPPANLEYLGNHQRFHTESYARRYVILDRILPLPVNTGYSAASVLVVSVNGIVVRNLAHLKQLVSARIAANEHIAFRLADGRLIVIDHNDLETSAELVRSRHGIPYLESQLGP